MSWAVSGIESDMTVGAMVSIVLKAEMNVPVMTFPTWS